MASDQTLPPVPLPFPLAAPNPDPSTPTAPPHLAADPTAPPPPPSSASAGARKLPVKRRSPPPRPSSPSSSSPVSSDPKNPHPQQPQQQPPFKFQRIWSESDELRFLQGLLGCGAQGMVFPRDLNVFYDRFSESMSQPYTRSQLSEKLRRLKNKFRGFSARIGRGLDPARLAPHDRDVLHLCSRLWDPANASTSPFGAAASSPGGGEASSGNKRRRASSRAGAGQLMLPAAPSGDGNSHDYNGISNGGTPAGAFPDGHGEEMMYLEQESGHFGYHGDAGIVADESLHGIVKEQPEAMVAVPNVGDVVVHNENGNGNAVVPRSDEHHMANAVLDIFDECLREVKANGVACGVNVDGSTKDNEFAKRWRAQRMDELDVLSRRLRLLVEDAAAAGR
uniref:Glabrous enhancer-binding protein-like DBD domain-containing protein n=1 Tax=Leersia perrieri TaxID=77586 RepID=A0A0D9VY17_9ORYZ